MASSSLLERNRQLVLAFMSEVKEVMDDPDFFVDSVDLFGLNRIVLKGKTNPDIQAFIHCDKNKLKASLLVVDYAYRQQAGTDEIRFQGIETKNINSFFEERAFAMLMEEFKLVHQLAAARSISESRLFDSA